MVLDRARFFALTFTGLVAATSVLWCFPPRLLHVHRVFYRRMAGQLGVFSLPFPLLRRTSKLFGRGRSCLHSALPWARSGFLTVGFFHAYGLVKSPSRLHPQVLLVSRHCWLCWPPFVPAALGPSVVPLILRRSLLRFFAPNGSCHGQNLNH